jgi:hypothetical protein
MDKAKRERSCEMKVRYKSKAIAMEIARGCLGRNGGLLARLGTYHCKCCDGWHLTKDLSRIGGGRTVERRAA